MHLMHTFFPFILQPILEIGMKMFPSLIITHCNDIFGIRLRGCFQAKVFFKICIIVFAITTGQDRVLYIVS